MKKNIINQKQLKRERERQLAEKKVELEAKYYEELREWKEIGLEEGFPFETLEKYLERGCKKLKEEHLDIPSGTYADWRKTTSEYQQRFIQYTCELCPDIFDELRQFVPLFDELFGENRERYNVIFNSYRMEIFELDSSLCSEIRYSIIRNHFLEFKPYKINNYDYDFRWGEYRLLFCLLIYKLVAPGDLDKKKELRNEIFDLIQKDLILRTDLIKEEFLIGTDLIKEELDQDLVQNYINGKCLDIIEYLLFGEDCNSFFDQANDSITIYLKHLLGENEQIHISNEITPNIEPFIKLQYGLVKWASSHHLGKDWILRYAYYFLSTFSENPNLDVSEIEIHSLSIRSLASYPFKFKFNGWLAGDETRANYELRLRESFEDELKKYFHGVYNFFELDKKKRLTRPKDYDRVKWLVSWTVQGWTMTKIFAEYDTSKQSDAIREFERFERKAFLAFNNFKQYNLPVRMKKHTENISHQKRQK